MMFCKIKPQETENSWKFIKLAKNYKQIGRSFCIIESPALL